MPSNRVVLTQEMLLAALGDDWRPSEVSAAAELLARSDGRFPSGIRMLPAELIKAVQRERLLAGMRRAVAELGHRAVSVQDVVERAGVSRPTFYEHFENKEDCFLTAFDVAAARLRDRLEVAVAEAGDRWRDRLRTGLRELLVFVATEPDPALTLIVEARSASPAAQQRRDRMLDRLAGWIDAQARDELPEPPLSVAAAGVVGGVEALLYSRLNSGETEDIESLLPSLMYFAVLPYAGHEAAAEELGAAALG
jgi:AcrR family transcriptional regulator